MRLGSRPGGKYDEVIVRRIRGVIILGPECSLTVKEHVEELFDRFMREDISPIFSEIDWIVVG